MMRMRSKVLAARTGALAAALLLGAACKDMTVPDYNNPSIDDFEAHPTVAGLKSAATGLFSGARQDITSRTGYVSMLGIFGRESYTLDASDPRYISELLVGPLTNSGAFGAGLWNLPYQNIRASNLILNAIDKIPGGDLGTADREAVRGFAQTMQAMDLLSIINTRDTNGAPIDVNTAIDAPPAPIATKDQVFARIVALLDEGRTHLAAGGASFPFPVSAGYSDFNTPAKFIKVNRAIKARVDAYIKNYAAAITDLNASFLDTAQPLTLGAYHAFGTGSGDVTNGLTSPTIYAHPSILSDAEHKLDASLDQRVQTKIMTVAPKTQQGLSSSIAFTMYQTPTASVPVIRNEELILLRAEARWFTGDKAGATADINFIRQTSGGLAPVAQPADDNAFVTELLKQRRYSLMFEGGHRWIDTRRFNRMTDLPKDQATHTIFARMLIPEAECLARGGASTC
jgi:hypothetical protein